MTNIEIPFISLVQLAAFFIMLLIGMAALVIYLLLKKPNQIVINNHIPAQGYVTTGFASTQNFSPPQGILTTNAPAFSGQTDLDQIAKQEEQISLKMKDIVFSDVGSASTEGMVSNIRNQIETVEDNSLNADVEKLRAIKVKG